MNRPKKIVRNIILIIILFFIFLKSAGLYLTPLSAHRASEKSIHYGPSQVVYIEDFDRGKNILAKYDKWISANTVNRSLFFFWRFGNGVIGIENDKTKAINYSYGMTGENSHYYGIINDEKIKRVEIVLENGEVFNETEFYDDMFLFVGTGSNDRFPRVTNIKGYDLEDNVIYEEDY